MDYTIKTKIQPKMASCPVEGKLYDLSKAIFCAGYRTDHRGGVDVTISAAHFEAILRHPTLNCVTPPDMSLRVFGINLIPDFSDKTDARAEYLIDLPEFDSGGHNVQFILEIN